MRPSTDCRDTLNFYMLGGKHGSFGVGKKRTLTKDEMRRVHDEQLVIEQRNYPGSEITIRVAPGTDDDGNPNWTVEIKRGP